MSPDGNVRSVLDELNSGSTYQQVEHRFLNGRQVDQVFSDQNAMGEILWYVQDAKQTVRDVATWDQHDGNYRPNLRRLTQRPVSRAASVSP